MPRFAARAAAAVVPALLALGTTAPAHSAPIVGPAGDAFYSVPSSVPASGTPGELVSYRPTTLKLPTGAPAHKAWNVLYRSTDAEGEPTFVTGTIAVPSSPASGRPNISYAFGTHGLGQQCAPSKQLAAGTDYEESNIAAALKKGYTVLATDFAGYTDGDRPSYTVAADEAHAVLDIVKAAGQVPNTGINSRAKTAIWGYSIGGQAAAAAGELQPSYAPDTNLVGVAAGGIPANLEATARNLNGGWGAAFLLGAVLGLQHQYPDAIPFDELANEAGQDARDSAYDECVFAQLNAYANRDIRSFTKDDLSLDDLLAIPSVNAAVDAQQLGTKPLPVPLYDYHGQADQFIPLDQAYELKRAYCARGTRVQYDLYPGEHLTTQMQGATGALSWIANRFAGQTAPTSCNANAIPTSTAPPSGGDQIVNLDKWILSGTVRLRTLATTLAIPPAGTITASANLTQQSLQANMSVPPFNSQIKVLGIPVRVAITLIPTGPITGTARLGDDGTLSVRGNAPVIVKVRSLGLGPIVIGADCRTERGVQIPVFYEETVGGLGDGRFGSTSTATFPNMVGCGLYGPILSALMSGPGQKFDLKFTPPAPKTLQ